jgi:hypothetical protein
MRRLFVFIVCVLGTAGCLGPLVRMPTSAVAPALPSAKEFRQGQIVYHSDADVGPEHPLFAELAGFPEQVCRALELPPTDRLIHVYLFKDRAIFEDYLRREFQDLPSRRALFVMRRDGLARQAEPRVYAFWGERIHDDLRHELTHATLHGILTEVPLWLDEGLAMYFEPGVAAHGRHARALESITAEMNKGTWRADLDRLAALDDLKQLHLADYHEVWAWVHFLLHGTPSQRALLLGYLQELRRTPKPTSLVPRFREGNGQLEGSLLKHLRQLMAECGEWPHQ